MSHWSGRARNFAPAANEPASVLSTDHNSGVISTLEINAEWRRLLAGLLTPLLFPSSWNGNDEDIELAIQLAHKLYNDLYEDIALIIRETINGYLAVNIDPIDLDVENGTGDYLFALAGDANGLNIDTDGIISGPPESFGDFDFAALIVDQGSGQTARRDYRLKTISDIYQRYLDTEPFFYLPLNEASGTVAYDYSGNDFDCNYENMSVGNSQFADGSPASSWDTSTSMIQTYSPDLYALFDSEEGSLFAWVRAVDADFWSNGNFGAIYELQHSAGQTLRLVKTPDTNYMSWRHAGNGADRDYQGSTGGPLSWFHVGLTWSASNGRVRAYLNSEIASELGAPSLIDGSIDASSMCIGRYTNSTPYRWYGNIAHFAMWDRELSESDVATICPAFLLG